MSSTQNFGTLKVRPKQKKELEGTIKLKTSQNQPPSVFAIEITHPVGNGLWIDYTAFSPNLKLYLEPSKTYHSKITYFGSPEEGKVYSIETGEHKFKNIRL